MVNEIYSILNDMSEILNMQQLHRLQEVLLEHLTEKTSEKNHPTDNMEYLDMFIAAKSIEGCSERTLTYYKTTIQNMFQKITTSVMQITTEMLREYLSEYQANNNCGKVTIDNIRRNLSSFFSWLEFDEAILGDSEEIKKRPEELRELYEKLSAKDKSLEEIRKANEELRNQMSQVRLDNIKFGRNFDVDKISEAETRKKYIDLDLQEAGWKFGVDCWTETTHFYY